jgi:hypothetical protein
MTLSPLCSTVPSDDAAYDSLVDTETREKKKQELDEKKTQETV